jgi:hypothetical protein
MVRNLKGEITDAELGMLNLMNAMQDPSLLKGMAEGLRQPEGRAELAKMMANPDFQKQAKRVVDDLRASGVVANFLKPEFYARKQGSSNALLPFCSRSIRQQVQPLRPGLQVLR